MSRELLAMRLGFSSFIEFQTGVAVSFTNAVEAYRMLECCNDSSCNYSELVSVQVRKHPDLPEFLSRTSLISCVYMPLSSPADVGVRMKRTYVKRT